MSKNDDASKAVVHVSGTLLRRNWYGQERTDCIIVRPGGDRRDSEGWIVHQVRFNGPVDMVFSAKQREAKQGQEKVTANSHGFVGTLPGFDNAIMVYLQADEEVVQVQPREGEDFVSLRALRNQAGELGIDVINPMLEENC